jgi:hypothetical protein
MTPIDDAAAVQILKTLAKARLAGVAEVPDARALRGAFADMTPVAGSEGELARATLELLAGDPAYAEPIATMARNAESGSARRFMEPSSVLLATAVMVALQTRLHFKRDSSGKWAFEMDKKAASDGLLKAVVERLLGLGTKG